MSKSQAEAAVGARRRATIIGFVDLLGRIVADASALYARNLTAFVALLVDKDGAPAREFDDEILSAALVTRGGAVVHPALKASE